MIFLPLPIDFAVVCIPGNKVDGGKQGLGAQRKEIECYFRCGQLVDLRLELGHVLIVTTGHVHQFWRSEEHHAGQKTIQEKTNVI
jgi:hypothetical protein